MFVIFDSLLATRTFVIEVCYKIVKFTIGHPIINLIK